MDCPQCGVRNEPASALCVRCGAALPAAAMSSGSGTVAVSTAKVAGRVFRDPKRLTQWVVCLLIGVAVADAIFATSELAQLQLLVRMRDGGFASEDEMMSAAEANDLRHGFIAIALLALNVITVVVFAMWIYRVASNTHALGSPNLRFRPGWAVGWYFVPIANLWKPYQAMKEIWRASKNPGAWQSETTSAVLGWWWFWWITSSICGRISMRLSLQAEALDELITVSPVIIAASAIDLVAAIFALLVVKRIGGFQAAAADRSLSAVFA
jgi:Domain of unknown function (DUF4328)